MYKAGILEVESFTCPLFLSLPANYNGLQRCWNYSTIVIKVQIIDYSLKK